MMNSKIIAIVAGIIVLAVGNLYLGLQYFTSQQELRDARSRLQSQQINERALRFAKLFIENVLEAEEEVDFETRLKLENAVRELEDEDVLGKWRTFVESATEAEAQHNVKELLKTIVGKIEGDR